LTDEYAGLRIRQYERKRARREKFLENSWRALIALAVLAGIAVEYHRLQVLDRLAQSPVVVYMPAERKATREFRPLASRGRRVGREATDPHYKGMLPALPDLPGRGEGE
jgi:hypothetical protein